MINNGKIYKYTNLINNKVYIGQTTQRLEDRDKKHLQQINDNTYFHRALMKYGRENFSLDLVEDNISQNDLDDKEKYYIDLFESFYTTGKGYNLTQGGQWGSGTQKLTLSQSKEIKELILNSKLTFEEIGKQYGVTLYCVSDINRGRSFYDNSLNYPLRPAPKRSILNEEKINLIVDMLSNTETNYKDIALTVDVNEYTIGEINRGANSWCPSDINYPIRKPIQQNTYKNILNKEQVIQICYDLCFTNITLKNIGEKHSVAQNTIGDISRGISWKDITNQFICPIRKNKKQNQEIYQSIYGIV